MKYAIIPHRGKWDKACIATSSDCWNEPLLGSYHSSAELESKSFVDLRNTGYQISAAGLQDGKIMLRLFNAEGDNAQQKNYFKHAFIPDRGSRSEWKLPGTKEDKNTCREN